MAGHPPLLGMLHEQEAKESPRSKENQDTSQVAKDKGKTEKAHVCHSEEGSDKELSPSKKLQATGSSSSLPACKKLACITSHR